MLNIFPFLKPKPKAFRQLIYSDWNKRSEITQPDVNLFCWDRPLDLRITHYLKSLLLNDLPPIRCSVDQENLHQQLRNACTAWNNNDWPAGGLFWQDVVRITEDFLQFSTDGTGVLHLKVVNDNACAKFHIDGYRLRLFSTYYGPGTQWLPENAVNRQALGTTNERIVVDPSKIQQMDTGHVAILKGEPFNRKNTVQGIVHRSPQIDRTECKRIILRIDV